MKKSAKTVSKITRIKGGFSGRGKKIGIIVAEFNEFLTERLLEGALDALTRHGVGKKDIQVVYVPGAFEIPLTLKKLLSRKKFDAVLTLAIVIKGQTRHFDQVVSETAKGVRELSQKSEIPVILGVISALNEQQAIQRVGLKHTNKGREWALAAIEMANLMPQLKNRGIAL
jgi:6,7-dimethyl-8-ribityllumazine synthase